jgi:hypothetical protein
MRGEQVLGGVDQPFAELADRLVGQDTWQGLGLRPILALANLYLLRHKFTT